MQGGSTPPVPAKSPIRTWVELSVFPHALEVALYPKTTKGT